ncbi:PREDICTED: E3 ubiquitin-protein ligase At1g12760-like isoform X2 [Lupinus angustifolius]|uniref:E3 ubiquitin-protein ligase At1g12760-like isoform X1 n=2 Tax=Lupinus angustifolius TaxID=3871 RepID=UPI00092E22A3|nr:PREDICTED: E3 ubiquitin-protein ligase At1g12760-like isoform X1 [Lupinus angustifolius]XP_019456042.1 PREDICTED: E3 ubiquitin-protein ligase At1g12760-like isoform X1 [Lupinus angustifolius]XP_019456043.1 PREDICTED: E3 ubiquitin-protein ligase At1g12760-like isoform X1 [Lupinus angustifolius]XP_019456044.1 PREDICTED: E3 ubiquitin-protein ligase At1g12760-like isoform X1 [Lupinus angustifolius]XP_019456045.1 PREDICTED: E3 ubiquitin-protein ligase At1g12760-like isoform X2 [Lupinus angustifol
MKLDSMNSRCSFHSSSMVSLSSNSARGEEDRVVSDLNRPLSHNLAPSFSIRMAMRISRARWFGFLRRVFHYQNGPRSHHDTNPFDSSIWMMLEFIALVVQIIITTSTLAMSKRERPVWPMRIWATSYDIGCVLNLLLLYGRYHQIYLTPGDTLNLSDLEHQRNNEETRFPHLMNKCKTSLELFFAIWFVMGNVWIFESSRFGYYNEAPKLHVLCITLLGWNAICYSFPFLLFVLLCCCVPLINCILGYNMVSSDKGATDDQISQLPSWTHKHVHTNLELVGNDSEGCENLINEDPECCICLAKYKEKEEVRELPCSHIFHKKCVDQWLKIISCCPLCKQGLERTK